MAVITNKQVSQPSVSTPAASSLTGNRSGATVGDSSTDSTGAATDQATLAMSSNPIGTGTAKLLDGDTQDQDNQLQQLKYDAYRISILQAGVSTLQSSGVTGDQMTNAQQILSDATDVYQKDLTAGVQEGLTGARVNRYLTGGAHPVPDNALIPSATDDLR